MVIYGLLWMLPPGSPWLYGEPWFSAVGMVRGPAKNNPGDLSQHDPQRHRYLEQSFPTYLTHHPFLTTQIDCKSQALLSLLTEKKSSRKFPSLRGSKLLPEKLLTQLYPQTRWDFSIILYCDSRQPLCIDYKDTRWNAWYQGATLIASRPTNHSYSVCCSVVRPRLIYSAHDL